MKNRTQDAELIISLESWAYCPNCGAKTKVGVYFDTVMLNFPLYCSKCKTETLVDVVQFKMVRSNKSESS